MKRYKLLRTVTGLEYSKGGNVNFQRNLFRFLSSSSPSNSYTGAVEGWSQDQGNRKSAVDSLSGNTSGDGQVTWRGMTAIERARHFPAAVGQLYEDCVQYQSIEDALRTPTNVWHQTDTEGTRYSLHRKEALSLLSPGSSNFHHGDDIHNSKANKSKNSSSPMLPWRQCVQQRQLVQDVTRVMIPLILWIPPIVGFIPTLLAVVAPRVAFTRHFHNDFEVVQFAIVDQEQRRVEFSRIVQLLCQNSNHLYWNQYYSLYFSVTERDAAGPLLLDAIGLYKAMFEESSPFHRSRLSGYVGLDDLPSNYVSHLALALGLYQSLPGPFLNEFMGKWVVPTFFLRAQVRKALYAMAEEDAQLLVEQQDQLHCRNLTDQEVLDACLMRNLPIVLVQEHNGGREGTGQTLQEALSRGPGVVDYSEMRKCLTQHLDTIAIVSEEVVKNVEIQHKGERPERQSEIAKELTGLFAAHLSILRYGYMNGFGQQ